VIAHDPDPVGPEPEAQHEAVPAEPGAALVPTPPQRQTPTQRNWARRLRPPSAEPRVAHTLGGVDTITVQHYIVQYIDTTAYNNN